MSELLLSVTQTAYILKVHPLTVRRYIREGKLKAVKIGGNIRIKESELNTFSQDVVPGSQIFRGNQRVFKKSVGIFTDIDPFFQLQGKGASINI